MKNLDDCSYVKFCGPQNLSKALNNLKGMIDGITLDDKVSEKELDELRSWCKENAGYRRLNPFNELIAKIDEATKDGMLDPEEIEDIKWYLARACSDNPYYVAATAELQYLQGLMHGILADGEVTATEVNHLTEWMHENADLAGCYPFDEVYSVLLDVMRDQKLDSKESELLKAYFAEFVTLSSNNQIRITSDLKKKVSTLGVCVIDPEIHFTGKIFTFTGFSIKGSRKNFASVIESTGAIFKDKVVTDIDYLIYGTGSNPFWAYSCYGRKVEQVMKLRKAGGKAVIIHENDFWDAYRDLKLERKPKGHGIE